MAINLGGLERQPDDRDFLLGSIQAPVPIPPTLHADISWLIPNWQGQTPSCGTHAATHLHAILDHQADGSAHRFTPRYSWIKVKQIDGFPISSGTDMRSIFKTLTTDGADAFEPLENDVNLPLPAYSDKSVVTPAMDATAFENKILSYAFGTTDFDSLRRYIAMNKAVLLLIRCDDAWWGNETPTFTTPKYGHFVVAYDYSPDAIYIVDSSDKNVPLKKILKKYITPTFIKESGTAIDLPAEQVKAIIDASQTIVTETVQAPITTTQKLGILQQLTALLQRFASLFQKVGATSQPSMNYSLIKSRTFWTAVLAFVFNGFTAISGSIPDTYSIPINFVLGSLITYFHVSGVTKAAVESAALGQAVSGQN